MSTAAYQPLGEDSEPSERSSLENRSEKPDSTRRTHPAKRWILWLLIAIIAATGGCIIGVAVTRLLFPSSPRWIHCGSTIEDAHERGCLYDVMIGSWLLPECSDTELMEEFIANRDWEFYKDQNLTEVIPMDELRLGLHDFPVWASIHQHQHHCAYVWMKQFRAVVNGKKLDDLSASMAHTRHCALGLYTGMSGAKENLALAVKYFSCVKPGEGNTRRPNNPSNALVTISTKPTQKAGAYQPLQSPTSRNSYDEYPETAQNAQQSSYLQSSRTRYTFKQGAAIICLVILVLAVGVYYAVESSATSATWSDCGNSVAEAQLRGCHFDSMMGAWLPAECYDKTLSDQWLEGEEGRWFADKNLTQPFPHSEVRKGNYSSAFTRPDFHFKHCAYMMLRFIVGVNNHQMLDKDAISVGHAGHCAHILADPSTDLGPFTRLNVGFRSCTRPRRSGWQALVAQASDSHEEAFRN
ncbi:hypothetical protein VTK73DRAFT_8058 [Phialemonium thermophilum]|uniref:Major facilitator superfamily transporter n=1 Tax=Phialemonium thermophilum TaxID=223376 RepID=A0ABR3XRE8_9PEZI